MKKEIQIMEDIDQENLDLSSAQMQLNFRRNQENFEFVLSFHLELQSF